MIVYPIIGRGLWPTHNNKSEIRNSKQIPMTKIQMNKTKTSARETQEKPKNTKKGASVHVLRFPTLLD